MRTKEEINSDKRGDERRDRIGKSGIARRMSKFTPPSNPPKLYCHCAVPQPQATPKRGWGQVHFCGKCKLLLRKEEE